MSVYTIDKIYRVAFMKDDFNYVGLTRNEKKFDLHQSVWVTINGRDLFKSEIVGVELPPTDNPDYLYKVSIPKDIVLNAYKWDFNKFYKGIDLDKIQLTCKSIFSTLEEAKASATENLERMYDLQKNAIERYFNQFIK